MTMGWPIPSITASTATSTDTKYAVGVQDVKFAAALADPSGIYGPPLFLHLYSSLNVSANAEKSSVGKVEPASYQANTRTWVGSVTYPNIPIGTHIITLVLADTDSEDITQVKRAFMSGGHLDKATEFIFNVLNDDKLAPQLTGSNLMLEFSAPALWQENTDTDTDTDPNKDTDTDADSSSDTDRGYQTYNQIAYKLEIVPPTGPMWSPDPTEYLHFIPGNPAVFKSELPLPNAPGTNAPAQGNYNITLTVFNKDDAKQTNEITAQVTV